MPNRIIKESICTSDTIAELTDFEFRLWIGLLVSADDAGRADARPAIIKGRIFPLRDRVTIRDIDAALHGLAAKGCVSLYTVGGKPYLWFPTWTEHQRIRDVKPKYPGIEDSDISPQTAADCGELPQTAADCGLNPIQSESEYESKSEYKSKRADARKLFAEFWSAYPRKVAKAEAEKAWKKLNPDEDLLLTMLNAIEAAKKSREWLDEGGKFIPHPTTWLNQRRWEDELSAPAGRLDNLQRLYEMFEEEEREQTRNS